MSDLDEPSHVCSTCKVSFSSQRELTKHRAHECFVDEDDLVHAASATQPHGAPGAVSTAERARQRVGGSSSSAATPAGEPAGGSSGSAATPAGEPAGGSSGSAAVDILAAAIRADADGDVDSDDPTAPRAPPAQSAAAALRAEQQEREIGGADLAYYHRLALLRRTGCAVHPLHSSRFGGLINFDQLQQSVAKSIVDFDSGSRRLADRFVPRKGAGSLDIKTRKLADSTLLAYSKELGLALVPRTLTFDDPASSSGRRSVSGFFAPWHALVKHAAENPFYYCEQRVAGTVQVSPTLTLTLTRTRTRTIALTPTLTLTLTVTPTLALTLSLTLT